MPTIEKYFPRLTPKYRLMLWLLSRGVTVDGVRGMSASELKAWRSRVPAEFVDIRDAIDIITQQLDSDSAVFTTTAGRKYSAKNIADLVERAHKIAGVKYKGVAAFVDSFAK